MPINRKGFAVMVAAAFSLAILGSAVTIDEAGAQQGGGGKSKKQFVFLRGQSTGPVGGAEIIYTVPAGCSLEITDIHVAAALSTTVGHHLANVAVVSNEPIPAGTSTFEKRYDVFAPETVFENLSTGVSAQAGGYVLIATAGGSGTLDYGIGGTLECADQ